MFAALHLSVVNILPIGLCMLPSVILFKLVAGNHMRLYEQSISVLYKRLYFYSSAFDSLAIVIFPLLLTMTPGLGCRVHVMDVPFLELSI